MKFLVLGATARTGLLFTTKALNEGHQVTAFVRRPNAAIDTRAAVVRGDVTDAAAIAAASRGHDAVISALGARNIRETPTFVTDAVRAIIAAAKISGVRRLVLVSAFGVGDSLATASFLVRPMFRGMLRRTYDDKAASEVLLKASDLDWTLEYPGALTNGDSSRYSVTALEDVRKTPLVPVTSRANVADFLLRSAVQNTFVRQTAVVFNTK